MSKCVFHNFSGPIFLVTCNYGTITDGIAISCNEGLGSETIERYEYTITNEDGAIIDTGFGNLWL